MPIHDWTRVEAGIFHDFHHGWIEEIKRALNAGLLPDDYYALAEQHASRFEPDVLTLQERLGGEGGGDAERESDSAGGGLLMAPPKIQVTAETDLAYYRRKQKTVTVRHVSGDRIVAMVEIVSSGNKSSRNALREFVRKSAALLNKQIHLLILDLHPPGRLDPEGIHGALWEYMTDQPYRLPADKLLTLAAYECDVALRAYVIHPAVSDTLVDMPLFLMPGGHVLVPLEATYQSAFAAVPRRWRRVLEAPST
jgi:hypothetical protein